MLVLAGVARDRASADVRVAAAIASGAALERFAEMVAAQGGDARVVDEPRGCRPPRIAPRSTRRGAGSWRHSTPKPWGARRSRSAPAAIARTRQIDPAVGILLRAAAG